MNITYIPPDIRAYLIAEALKFVLAASKLPGVTRIALISSLITDKQEPKDADLIVTVMDDTDLEPLARIGRKLKGPAQTINRGGDIFRTDPRGNYIGPLLHWRKWHFR